MEIILRFFQTIIVLLGWLLSPIFRIKSNKKKILPQINNPLLKLSATALARKIRKREVTSAEVVSAYIQRIKQIDPILNAVVEDRFALALTDAKNVDKYLEENSVSEDELEKTQPLLGVPFTVKESCSLEGLSHCGGHLPRIGVKASNDGDAVAALKAAGAIPLLVSNIPEMCLSWESDNLVTGATRNPYNTSRVSGGSSGGEGALLGAGGSIIGMGSDIAGSIRIPAMFNGIFGHKPTAGIVSLKGHFPYTYDKNFGQYLVIGPMTRYAEDLKLMTKIMAQKNANKLNLNEKVDLSKINVYHMEEAGPIFSILSTETEIKQAMKKCLNHLQEICHSNVKDSVFREMEDTTELSLSLFLNMDDIPNPLHDPENPKQTNNLYIEILKSLLGHSKYSIHALLFHFLITIRALIPKSRFGYYSSQAEFLKNKFEFELGNNGVFLYPTFPVAAFHHGESFLKVSGVMYSMIFNILGFPATHVPLGFNRDGMPIGIQVVACPNQDRLCFAVAEELERKFGGWIEAH